MNKHFFIITMVLLVGSCTSHLPIVQVQPQVKKISTDGQVLKRKVAIARFSNETEYAKGVFYNKENDPLGRQAVDLLSAKLVASDKFILLERQDMDKILKEIEIAGNDRFQKVGADYILVGSITEFGRKNVGDLNAFSRVKTQTVYVGVSIRLIDVSTGLLVYSEEAKGEAVTSNKTVMGFGERTDFDATLSDKAISAAISKLVENIINNCMERPWKSYFLSYDENGIFISGGKSQGLKIGDVFDIVEKGKVINNPQTGMLVELPGKVVGKIKIDLIAGDNIQNEVSMVSIISGEVEKDKLNNYYIKQII